MKECPKCNRSYADEALIYCLDDGSLLSVVYEPQPTLLVPPPRSTNSQPTEVLLSTPPNSQTARQGINPRFIYAVITLMAIMILALVGYIFWANNLNNSFNEKSATPNNREVSDNTKPVKSAPTPSQSTSPTAPVIVKVYNVDDLAIVYVNGSQAFQVPFNTSKQVDITKQLRPGKNEVRLVLQNSERGYSYGFEINRNNESIFKEDCGKLNVNGCKGNEFRIGTVYDRTVIVDSN